MPRQRSLGAGCVVTIPTVSPDVLLLTLEGLVAAMRTLRRVPMNIFVVHHNPNNGRYEYDANPNDAIESAEALVRGATGRWVAGNCQRMLQEGDLLLFKFGGARLEQKPGIYAAAHVTRAPARDRSGIWVMQYAPDAALTRRLLRAPIVGSELERVVSRSFGSSIQVVKPRGRAALAKLLDLRPGAASRGSSPLTHALLVLQEPLDKILAGTKTWEIRGKATARRGRIALVQSKSGHVVGTCELVDVVGPLTLAELRKNARRTGFRPDELPYSTTHAWVLRNARRLAEPVPYRHPPGAVIWVKLDSRVIRRIDRQSI